MTQKSSPFESHSALSSPTTYRAHPWHGLSLGEGAPALVTCYIEMVPADTIKYELDKETGILKVDRPQKYSSLCPTLYGLLPQTYAGERVAQHCRQKTGKNHLVGDGDPLDICVLTEKVIPRGDIILQAYPIGGLRLIDDDQADDKIIAILKEDSVYEKFRDIHDCPEKLIERLKHYFLTYKDAPGCLHSKVHITHTYGAAEAQEIIQLGQQDYRALFKTNGL